MGKVLARQAGSKITARLIVLSTSSVSSSSKFLYALIHLIHNCMK